MIDRLTAFAGTAGFRMLVAALLIVTVAVQTVRLEGFRIWPLEVEGALARAERLEGEVKAILDAQRAAQGAQEAVNGAAEEIYRDVAERIDNHAQADLAQQLDAADRFIAANRVRCPAAGGPTGRAGAAAAGDGTGRAQGTGRTAELDAAGSAAGDPAAGGDYVVVPADDVRICTANTVKAEAGQAYALGIEAASGN